MVVEWANRPQTLRAEVYCPISVVQVQVAGGGFDSGRVLIVPRFRNNAYCLCRRNRRSGVGCRIQKYRPQTFKPRRCRTVTVMQSRVENHKIVKQPVIHDASKASEAGKTTVGKFRETMTR
jgi:hypothetical protein